MGWIVYFNRYNFSVGKKMAEQIQKNRDTKIPSDVYINQGLKPKIYFLISFSILISISVFWHKQTLKHLSYYKICYCFMSGLIITSIHHLILNGCSKTYQHPSNNLCNLFYYNVHLCGIPKKIIVLNKYNSKQSLNIHFFRRSVMQMDVFSI